MRTTTTTYEVKSSIALVYSSSSRWSSILTKLSKGIQIEVISISKNWAYFIYNGKDAYIKCNSIKKVISNILGTITVKYINIDTEEEILESAIYSNLELKSYTYEAKSIDGYTLSDESTKTITLTKDNPNQTIAFYYKKDIIYGTITIKYLNADTQEPILDDEVYNNLELGDYTYLAKDITNYKLSSSQSVTVTLTENNTTSTVIFEYKLKAISLECSDINPNEVPYISTYYIKPIIAPDEEIIIDYYITDYYHKEYVNEDYSEIFTVTVRIEGKDDIIIENLQAGDHSVSLGTFPNLDGQEQKFSILCTDKCDRNSHELFNFFLVRNEIPVNEYIMTEEDLTTYGISNTNDTTMITSTREGLQKLLDDKQAAGYNRLKLLEGTYSVDHLGTIYIPTMFTLDMNGATLKLHEFAGDKALMMELNNTFDSHVINGTIEGDMLNHDYDNSPNSSEWVNGISIGGESKYSSYENLIIKDITGYGTINGIKNSRDGKLGYTYSVPVKGAIGDTFKLGDIDRNTGLDIESTNRTTCDFMDISGYSNIGYLSVSIYLGYQGNPCGTWNLICHFYDKNKNFIKSTDAYQYRRVGVPSNAKFMRVTILNEAYPTNLSIQLFRLPTHCTFKDLYLENCRAVGMAPQGMNNLLFENCELTNCGSAVTKCALDAEDGWDMMQDITFRKLNFHDNPYNEFLICAGHNFILENSTCTIYIWGRIRNLVIRNSEIKGARIHNDGIVKTGISRFINNILTSQLTFANADNSIFNSIIRNCTLLGTALNCFVINSSINVPNGIFNNTKLYKCSIKNIGAYINDLVYFDSCTFTSDTGSSSNLKFNVANGYKEFNNCTFYGKTSLDGNYFGKGLFNNCTFEDVNLNITTDNNINDLVFTDCKISYIGTNFITVNNNSNITFNNCSITESTSNTITSLVYLKQEPSSGQTIFNNCNINKTNGYVLDGYYNPGYKNKSANYEVKLSKSPISIPSLSNKFENSPLQLYKVVIS